MSADDRFDELGKALAASTSRRKFLKVAAAAAAAGVLSAVRAPSAAADHNDRCRESGANCRSNAECCTHFCGSGHCACAVPCEGATNGTTTGCCAAGDVCCPGGGQPQCIKSAATLCSGGQIFNAATCKCENVSTPSCGANTCPGCCRNNNCFEGTSIVNCGSGGATCKTCTGSNVCCGGECKLPNGVACNGNGQCCSNRCRSGFCTA